MQNDPLVPSDSHHAHGAIDVAPLLPGPNPVWTRNRILAIVVAFVTALGAMLVLQGVYLSPDRYFLILLAPAAVLGVGKGYARDFLPLILAILLYEELRGLAHLIDQVLGLLNRAHFIVPPTLLFIIWLDRREHYYRCATALVGASLIGAVIFLLYPAAPPWAASQAGLLPPLTKIGYAQAAAAPVSAGKSWIESLMLPNPYAAVPSLHTAYSTLVAIFALSWKRRFGYVMLLYPLAMYFCIVYFADHYISDILVGIAVALLAWWGSGRLINRPFGLGALAGPFTPPISTARFGRPLR